MQGNPSPSLPSPPPAPFPTNERRLNEWKTSAHPPSPLSLLLSRAGASSQSKRKEASQPANRVGAEQALKPEQMKEKRERGEGEGKGGGEGGEAAQDHKTNHTQAVCCIHHGINSYTSLCTWNRVFRDETTWRSFVEWDTLAALMVKTHRAAIYTAARRTDRDLHL